MATAATTHVIRRESGDYHFHDSGRPSNDWSTTAKIAGFVLGLGIAALGGYCAYLSVNLAPVLGKKLAVLLSVGLGAGGLFVSHSTANSMYKDWKAYKEKTIREGEALPYSKLSLAQWFFLSQEALDHCKNLP